MTPSGKSRVYFFFKKPVSLRDRTKLKKFIERAFRKEKKKLAGLNFIFCSDEELLSINKQYLKHDYYTDIITFDLSEAGYPIYGEIYISVDRVRDNAGNAGEPFHRELHRVIFHGVLHLCGYKDKTKEEKAGMRRLEDEMLEKYCK